MFVKLLLDENNISYIEHDRTILDGLELDIYIPDKNTAIECNGIYWHSNKSKYYHIDKYLKCKSKGVRLISIWEDWVCNCPEIVKSTILYLLGIYKTNITDFEVKEIHDNDFLEENNLFGKTKSSIHMGCFNNGELCKIMAFSKSKNNQWNITRNCNKLYTNIVDGEKEILNYFISKYNPSSICININNDIDNKTIYEAIGFTTNDKIIKSKYFVHKDSMMRTKRYFNSNKFFEIYDSGKTKYMLNIS